MTIEVRDSLEIFEKYLDELLDGNLPSSLQKSRFQSMVKFLEAKQEAIRQFGFDSPVIALAVEQLKAMTAGVNRDYLLAIKQSIRPAINKIGSDILTQRRKCRPI